MKIFMKSLIWILGAWTLLHATDVVGVETDSYTSPTLFNEGGLTDIVNLSGTDTTDNLVENFIIKSLPDANTGRLVMGDGVTSVTLNQHVTMQEVYGLCFHPLSTFVGDTSFTYVAVDNNGVEGNIGTITIPVVDVKTKPTTDDKLNSEMLNSLDSVNILNLSGTDANGNVINSFVINSLPQADEGVLYMADGTTLVTIGQELTLDEANGLQFDPSESFVGDATFTYLAVDDEGRDGNIATVTLPIIAVAVVNAPVTDAKVNPQMVHTLGAVNILNLSGTDSDGNPVENFIITALPFTSQGVLYMADGTTPVSVNQALTLEEANGLKFDPTKGFVGDATFQYVAVDNAGIRGNIAVVRIPVIAEKGCTCKPYKEDIPVFSNVGLFLMLFFGMSLGLFLTRREITEL